MMTTDLLRGGAALAFLSVHSNEDMWIVYGVSTLLACGEALYAPARKSSIPLLVRPSDLLRVNSLEQVMSGLVLVIGAAAGGIVSAFFGPQAAFMLNSASFFAAGLIVCNIAFPPVTKEEVTRADAHTESRGSQTSFDDRILGRSQILQCIRISLPLQVVIAFELLVPFINGIDNVLISVYAVQEFKLGDAGIGLFYAALGAGLVASYALGRLFSRSLLSGGLVCLLLEGILLMGLSGIDHAWAAVAIYFFISLAGGVGGNLFGYTINAGDPAVFTGAIAGHADSVESRDYRHIHVWSRGCSGNHRAAYVRFDWRSRICHDIYRHNDLLYKGSQP